jgi:hypothetical protein
MNSISPSREGRRFERMRTFMAARISYGNGANLLDCTIRNISDGGAKLQISGGVTLPGEFELIIPQRGVRRRVRLCWRTEDFCGVAYLDDDDAAGQGRSHPHAQATLQAAAQEFESNDALRQHIRELEATIAQMQRRIDELSGGI